MWGLQVGGHVGPTVGPTGVWTCGTYRCMDTWGLQVCRHVGLCGHVGPTGVWTRGPTGV